MAIEAHSLVEEETTSTGTSTITLSGIDSRQTFNEAFGTGSADHFYYFITHNSADEWEYGTGHLTNATTLSRDTVLGSSNADSLVNFSAGTKTVVSDIPGETQKNFLSRTADIEVDTDTTRTLTAADNGKTIYFTATGAITVTLPQDSTENLTAGFQCVLVKASTGDVQATTEGTDNFNSPSNFDTLITQNKMGMVQKRASGEWHGEGFES